jgi:hypothetical protein
MYFYRVETTDASGQKIESGVSTFSAAVLPGTPIAYAIIGDTQFNPVVSSKLCEHAWAQRPSFVSTPAIWWTPGSMTRSGRSISSPVCGR